MDQIKETEILARAKALLAGGSVGDPALQKNAIVLNPLPVTEPGGGLHSWWVPITVADKLVAFFQYQRNGVFMRFSTFQRQPGNYENCPQAKLWLDTDTIQKIAAARIRSGETLQQPHLGFDQSPDRLAWIVPATDANGNQRNIYVTSGYAYDGS